MLNEPTTFFSLESQRILGKPCGKGLRRCCEKRIEKNFSSISI
jgi:hypothetical protein